MDLVFCSIQDTFFSHNSAVQTCCYLFLIHILDLMSAHGSPGGESAREAIIMEKIKVCMLDLYCIKFLMYLMSSLNRLLGNLNHLMMMRVLLDISWRRKL